MNPPVDNFVDDGQAGEDGTRRALSVSELNREARRLLEAGLPPVWVEGEISNLARPASGHLYFSLKDAGAQIRCAFFRGRQRGLGFRPDNGQQVVAHGRVSLYEPRGDYQLIVEQLEAAGEGELRRRFEALKRRLAAEGLFDEALKRPLPKFPRRIGVVTSPSGAAIRDILNILARRFPAAPALIYPVAVQGAAALGEIVAALGLASRRGECDVLVLARGGGSLEDLQAFNEEAVARAIRASEIPVVTGIGHEIDFTIADFAADLRAPTPSGAAELVVPDGHEWLARIARTRAALEGATTRLVRERAQRADWLARRLAQQSPRRRLERQAERLANLNRRLAGSVRAWLAARSARLTAACTSLARHSPERALDALGRRHALASAALAGAMRRRLERLTTRRTIASRALDTVSPLATLARGYAIVSDAETGRVLTKAADTGPGRAVSAQLAEGGLLAEVKETRDE